jgi:hypothetical protein
VSNFSGGLKREIQELEVLHGLEISEEREEAIKKFLDLDKTSKQILLLLQEFQYRKRRTIKWLYEFFYKDEEVSYSSVGLVRLKHMYENSIEQIIAVFTLFMWESKASGDLYSIDGQISYEKAVKIPTEYRNGLIDKLYAHSGKKYDYRIFSYADLKKEKLIFLLYKKVGDGPVADF